jgi:hypothetical protein
MADTDRSYSWWTFEIVVSARNRGREGHAQTKEENEALRAVAVAQVRKLKSELDHTNRLIVRSREVANETWAILRQRHTMIAN